MTTTKQWRWQLLNKSRHFRFRDFLVKWLETQVKSSNSSPKFEWRNFVIDFGRERRPKIFGILETWQLWEQSRGFERCQEIWRWGHFKEEDLSSSGQARTTSWYAEPSSSDLWYDFFVVKQLLGRSLFCQWWRKLNLQLMRIMSKNYGQVPRLMRGKKPLELDEEEQEDSISFLTNEWNFFYVSFSRILNF